MKNFTSEQLKEMAIETISDSGDSNFKRVFDTVWDDLDGLFTDDTTVEEKKIILRKTLQLYGQMITMESVNLTLNALVETGTLGDEFKD